MKKILLVFLSFCFSSLFFTHLVSAGDRGGGGGGFGFRSDASVFPRIRSFGVRSVPRYGNRTQLFSVGRSRSLGLPSQGPRGGSFRASLVSPRAMGSSAVRNNMQAINNVGFRSQINHFNAHESIVGRYYWHTYNGLNFCHYYDRWGYNWYGWYCGSGFYWSCWWGNNWWWYDPAYYRWCYWYDGWWWWQDPDNVTVTYIYNNGQYVPANSEESQSSETTDTQVSANNVPSIQTQTYRNKDGTRMVKLAGASGDAFLYDTTDTPAFKTKYLASNVKTVHFSNTSNGKPLRIMLGLTDGTFESYDADGNSTGTN